MASYCSACVGGRRLSALLNAAANGATGRIIGRRPSAFHSSIGSVASCTSGPVHAGANVAPCAASSSRADVGVNRRRSLDPLASNNDDAEGLLLPAMSVDGGSQREFEEYWRANAEPVRLGSWVERRAHPQVNALPYWFDEETRTTRWCRPMGSSSASASSSTARLAEQPAPPPALCGEGAAWSLGIPELKEALAYGRSADLGLSWPDLARRAVHEYETFEPRVLSWHDYQHITFWFFGGIRKPSAKPGDRRGKGSAGNMFKSAEATRELFAPSGFFDEAATLIEQRLGMMHPICLTYFIWTFVRAGAVRPELLKAVGDHLCEGRLPMMDRCSLGTMLWNFGKVGVRHDRLFAEAAKELSRPNRVRSLAPRNYQNTLLAYGWAKHGNRRLFSSLLAGVRRQLDGHDPPGPKLSRSLCFSYTCKDGFEVLADSFRISSLTIMVRSLHRMEVDVPETEACIGSMVDYARRSVLQSPQLMRENGDACRLLLALAHYLRDVPGIQEAARHLDPKHVDFALLCRDASDTDREKLRRALARAGLAAAAAAAL